MRFMEAITRELQVTSYMLHGVLHRLESGSRCVIKNLLWQRRRKQVAQGRCNLEPVQRQSPPAADGVAGVGGGIHLNRLPSELE